MTDTAYEFDQIIPARIDICYCLIKDVSEFYFETQEQRLYFINILIGLQITFSKFQTFS